MEHKILVIKVRRNPNWDYGVGRKDKRAPICRRNAIVGTTFTGLRREDRHGFFVFAIL